MRPENNLLDDDAVLSWLNSVRLHLKLVYSVFLFIRNNVDLSRQLSPLSNGHKGGTEPQGENGAEKETSSVQADDDIDLAGRR